MVHGIPGAAVETDLADDEDASSQFAEGVFRPASDLLREDSALASVQGEEQLRRYAERFQIVNEVHQALASTMSLDEVLDLILERVFNYLEPDEGVIFLKDEAGGFQPVAQRRAPGWTEDYLYSQTLMEEVAVKGMAARVVDLCTDDRFTGSASIEAAGVLSLMAAPLLTSEGSLGLIAVNSRLHLHHFSDQDVELLISLAAVAAIRIQNQQLADEAAERRHLEKELALAREIQVGLHPKKLPRIRGYWIDAGSLPSSGVSGDFYKVVERSVSPPSIPPGGRSVSPPSIPPGGRSVSPPSIPPGGRAGGAECVLLVADVSGKGMSAALLTATAEALASVSIAEGLPAERICCRVSDLLEERTPPAKFVSAFLGVLEPESGRLTWTNAGHNPPLLVRASGGVEQLAGPWLPLGLLPGFEYGAEESVLRPGDILVVYTDGITEATNPDGEAYGLERLIAVCRRYADGVSPPDSPRGDRRDAVDRTPGAVSSGVLNLETDRRKRRTRLIDAIDRDLSEFADGVPFADDRTLVVVHHHEEAAD